VRGEVGAPTRAGHRRDERQGETDRLAHFEHGCAAVPVGQLRRHSGRKRLHNHPDRCRMRALMNGMGGSVRLMGENSYAGDEFINGEGETETGRRASCFYHGKGLGYAIALAHSRVRATFRRGCVSTTRLTETFPSTMRITQKYSHDCNEIVEIFPRFFWLLKNRLKYLILYRRRRTQNTHHMITGITKYRLITASR